MKVFLSYAQKDHELAQKLAALLGHKGLTVSNFQDDIFPGENWRKQIGKALDEAQAMVILLTPGAMQFQWLRDDIEFALGSKKLAGRVFTVFAGPTSVTGKDIPWILLRLPHEQVGSEQDFRKVARKIKAWSKKPVLSHANA